MNDTRIPAYYISSIQYTGTASYRYLIHSVHRLYARLKNTFRHNYYIESKCWLDRQAASIWSAARGSNHAQWGTWAMRLRLLDDHFIQRPLERKSSQGAKEIRNYNVMVLCRYAVIQAFSNVERTCKRNV